MKKFLFITILLWLASEAVAQRTTTRYLSLGCNIQQVGSSSGKPHVSCNCSDTGGTYDASNIAVGDTLYFNDGGVGYALPIDSIVTPGVPTLVVRADWTGLGLVLVPTGRGGISRSAVNGLKGTIAGLTAADNQYLEEDFVSNIGGAISFVSLYKGTTTKFAADTDVAPDTTGAPSTNEIEVWNYTTQDTNWLNSIIFYTGGDDSTAVITYIYFIDSDGNASLLESPSDPLNLTRRIIPSPAFANAAAPLDSEALTFINALSPPALPSTIFVQADGAVPGSGTSDNPETAWVYDGTNVTRIKDFPRKFEVPGSAFSDSTAATGAEVLTWLSSNPQTGNYLMAYHIGSGTEDKPDFAWFIAGDTDLTSADIVTIKEPGGVADGDKTDVDVSSSGSVWTIDTSAVTTVKIANDAVTGAKIAASTIDSTKIATGGIGNTDLAAGIVTTTKIADDAVTLAKQAAGTANRLVGFDGSGNPSEIAAGTNVTISGGSISTPSVVVTDTLDDLPAAAAFKAADRLVLTDSTGTFQKLIEQARDSQYIHTHSRQSISDIYTNAEFLKIGERLALPNGANYIIEGSNYTIEPDSFFVMELYAPKSNAENLFGNSESLNTDNLIQGMWNYPGAIDLEVIRDAAIGPDSTVLADAIVRPAGSDREIAHILSDTIFSGVQYYFSFWFRAGPSTPTSGVVLNWCYFRGQAGYTSGATPINLNTSDQEWRQYSVALAIPTQNVLPLGASGGSFNMLFSGLAATDTVYMTKMLLTQDPNYTYYKTPTKATIKKGRLYAMIDLDGGRLKLNEIPKTTTEVATAQKAIDYAFSRNYSFTLDVSEGFEFTQHDTTLFLRDGTALVGNYNGRSVQQIDSNYIKVNLNNAAINAIEIVPDIANSKSEPVGATMRNLRFEVRSPVKSVFNGNNGLTTDVDNVAFFCNDLAETGIRYENKSWPPAPTANGGPIHNTLSRVRVWNATGQAGYFKGGSINNVYNSQFHRSNIGVVIDGGQWTMRDSWIEKSDSFALIVESGTKMVFDNNYIESPNYEGAGLTAAYIQQCDEVTFSNNHITTATSNTRCAIVTDTVGELNVYGNTWAGTTLSADGDSVILVMQPDFTRSSIFGNESTNGGEVQNTFEDMLLDRPVLNDATSYDGLYDGGILNDTIVFSEMVIGSKINYITNSENITAAGGWTINAGRLTVVSNDTINPIDGALNAEKVTAISTSAKLMKPNLGGHVIDHTKYYALKFWVRPGWESFNDNITFSIQYNTAAGTQAFNLAGFSGATKDWQLIDTVFLFNGAVTDNPQIKANMDVSDYFFISGAQLTQGPRQTDYIRTVGGSGKGNAKVNIEDGIDLEIVGDLQLDGALVDSSGSPGTAGQIPVSTVTGWAWGSTSSALDANYFKQGGNSFGASAILGTNDANSLNFETNNVTYATLSSGGGFGLINSRFSVFGTGVLDTVSAAQITISNTTALQAATLHMSNAGSFNITANSPNLIGSTNTGISAGNVLTTNASDSSRHHATNYVEIGRTLNKAVFDSDSTIIFEINAVDVLTAKPTGQIIFKDYVLTETTTSPSTGVVSAILPVDCALASKTVNPPAAPTAGDWFAVSDSRGNAGTNNITIDFTTATQNLHGASANYVMNADADFVKFTYVNSTVGWIKTN